MANLATMQRYADKCAEKLGITDEVILRWHGGDCKLQKSEAAHCHVCKHTNYRNAYPRGTICLRRDTWRLKTVKDWHYLIAHEVAHLATKSSHSSPTFARRMMALGQADHREKQRVLASRKHRHIYSLTVISNGKVGRLCSICYKEQPVTPDLRAGRA